MTADPWEHLLLAWLHDPVDKPSDIRGHESRARRYARIVLDRDVSESELTGGTPDYVASAYERLPMPAGNRDETRVSPEMGTLRVIHPLSADAIEIPSILDESATAAKLRTLLPKDLSYRDRFLRLWRYGPELFSPYTPAETRNPDHTLWHHLDTTSAIAVAQSAGGTALLSFKISPVQPFIEASRSLRDLLSGSYLLSWLCFSAMNPVLEACGPTAFIYPALRGAPLMDWWLRKQGVVGSLTKAGREELARASLPNRFLALVPAQKAEELADAVQEAARSAWLATAADVRKRLKVKYDAEFPDWDRLWDSQIRSYFDFRSVWVKPSETDFETLFGKDETLRTRKLGPLADPAYRKIDNSGLWQRSVMVSAALMEATTRIRHIPAYRPHGEVPQKCTLFGTYEQMGPTRLADSRRFWEKESRKEDADRRCAVALVKRHAFEAHFEEKLGLNDVYFPDTESLAGTNESYFAILAMDGDDLGKWLSGEQSPTVGEVLHPKILRYFEQDPARKEALQSRRPVSPALHAAISAGLMNFAVRLAPAIVERHHAQLIYSGGDDLLAALPVQGSLNCAFELRQAYRSWGCMGSKAGISGGLAIAHVKEDLRYALQCARTAEKRSKEEGKDRLTLAIVRRSGEHSYASCPWQYIPTFVRQIEHFRTTGSDRWTYLLRGQTDILSTLPAEAFASELRRLLKRSEHADPQFAEDFETYRLLVDDRAPQNFVALCQSAGFLARGRD